MRIALYLVLLLSSLSTTYAQLRIGVRVMPALSFTSAYADVEQSDFDGKPHLLLGAGMFFELGQSERYRILLSLNYFPKRTHYTYSLSDKTTSLTAEGSNAHLMGEEHHRLQYASIGGGVRLLTDELFTASRIYFEAEPLVEFKILERRKSKKSEELITKISFADVSLRIGVGIEIEIGVDTAIFAGPSFNFGLLNVASESILAEDLRIKNHLLALNLGIRF